MKTKFNKESRNLIIGMLLGDGTISNNYVFKLSHGYKQKEYLEWKINLLNEYGIKNNGLKEYISTCGYNLGSIVYYSQTSVIPFMKVLRRVIYKPIKNYANRKILNRLNSLGLAIWYMDDGCINIRKTNDKIHGFYIRIATCLYKEQNQIIIDYFKEVWDISFYQFKEGRPGKNTYSLCCGTQEGVKFIELIKPYVESCPSMLYKIQYDLSQRRDYVA
jgi:recombination protein RecA